MATRYRIADRKKPMELEPSSFEDFTYDDPSKMDPNMLLEEAGWSAYAFDGANVMFVRVPNVDLAAVAFAYVAQYDGATELAIASIDEVVETAQHLPLPDLVLIHSIGRCGTTLANHVLNASDEIWCVSEPDVIDPVAASGNQELTRAICKLLYANRNKISARVLGIKFRSQSLFEADKIAASLPDAKTVFMYRDAIGWGNSNYTMFGKLGVVGPIQREMVAFGWEKFTRTPFTEHVEKLPGMAGAEIEPGAFLAHAWQRYLEEFHKHKNAGIDMHVIRYNEFNSDREVGVKELFAACGLADIDLDGVLAAFAVDSQKGTFMGQIDKPLKMNPAQIDVFKDILSKHPVFSSPDHMLT